MKSREVDLSRDTSEQFPKTESTTTYKMSEPPYYYFKMPEQSEWRCELFGGGPMGVVLTPNKGQEPNWFWRWMQYLAFGNKWIKPKRAP